jgi:F0F1-type ATP synthase assembly protein I
VAVACLALLAPLALGLTIDDLFGTAPWGLLICAAIGIVAATIFTVRTMTRRMAALATPLPSADSPDAGSHEKEDRA